MSEELLISQLYKLLAEKDAEIEEYKNRAEKAEASLISIEKTIKRVAKLKACEDSPMPLYRELWDYLKDAERIYEGEVIQETSSETIGSK